MQRGLENQCWELLRKKMQDGNMLTNGHDKANRIKGDIRLPTFKCNYK
jgi:hypothetical protein